jgi:hypothetical protein
VLESFDVSNFQEDVILSERFLGIEDEEDDAV